MRTPPARTIKLILTSWLAVGMLSAATSHAGTLYWAPGGVIGATGTWDASTTPNWSPNSDGTLPGLWNQTGGEDMADIRFTSINRTVTISGTVNANKLVVTTPGVTNPNVKLTGGTLHLTGDAIIESKEILNSNNQWFEINTTITGANGVTYTGVASYILSGTGVYTGTTVVSSSNPSRPTDVSSSTAIPAHSTLDLRSFMRVRNNVHLTVAGITGPISGNLQFQGIAGSRSITLIRNDGVTRTYEGVWTGGVAVDLIKQGNYTQVFGGGAANANPGNLTIEGGVFALAKSAGNAVSSSTILITGGALRLDVANQILNTTTMNLSGGTFNANGKNDTLGALTVTANSVLDFGAAAIVQFASVTRTGGTLTVRNWNGDSRNGGGSDQLRVTALPPQAFLDNLVFEGFDSKRVLDKGTYYEIVGSPYIGTSITVR